MKKLLLSLCALCVAAVMNAQKEVTFDFDNDATALFGIAGRSSSDSHDGDILTDATATVDGVSVTVSPKASGSNENRLWTSSPVLRMYSGTMTVSAPGMNIAAISFVSSKFDASNTFDSGTYSNYVWTADGNTSTVVLTVNKNTQLKGMTVTLASEGQVVVPKPTVSVAGGTYYEPQTVVMTAEEGLVIKYTLNGGAEQTYTAPIVISEATTLVVWTVDAQGNQSAQMTYVYQFDTATAGTLANAIAAAKGDVTTIDEPMTVVYQSGTYLYVKAGEAYGLIYGSVAYKYQPGDVIAAGVTVTTDIYNGLVELKDAQGLTEGVPGTPVEAIETDAQTCADAAWVNRYVVIRGASYTAATKTLTDSRGDITLYKRFNECALPTEDMSNATVYGLVSVYNGTYQIYPTSITGDQGDEPDVPEDPTEPKDVLEVEGNLLQNGSFEAWSEGVPECWNGVGGNATVSAVTTKDAHTGSAALKIASASSNKRVAYQAITLDAGVYEFSFYVRAAEEGAESTRVVPGYVPIDEEGKAISSKYTYNYDAVAEGLTTEYQKVSSVFELSEATTVNMVIMQSKNTAMTIVDDAALVRLRDYDAINAAAAAAGADVIYTLGGVRVKQAVRGVNVIGGQKYFVK